jgi:hypothetical protein
MFVRPQQFPHPLTQRQAQRLASPAVVAGFSGALLPRRVGAGLLQRLQQLQQRLAV